MNAGFHSTPWRRLDTAPPPPSPWVGRQRPLPRAHHAPTLAPWPIMSAFVRSSTTGTSNARRRRRTSGSSESGEGSEESNAGTTTTIDDHSGTMQAPQAGGAQSTGGPSAHHSHTAAQQPRAASSCTECGRRKIKCDKNRPCSSCVQRGEEGLCRSGTYKRIRTDR